MARLVRGLDDEVYVQFGELAVFFEGNEGDILLETAHEDDLALIRLEAWDSAPPAPGDPWTPVEDTTVEGGTGWVTVGSVAEEATRSMAIGPPHFLYGVTAHTQEAGELPEYTTEEEFQRAWDDRRLARWLIRFWPIRDVFDPVRHARPDHAGGREPTPVEPPVSEAAEWSVGQVARRETALLEHLAGGGMTMAGYLAEQGLDPGLPFDRVVAAMVRRELPAMVERQGLPDWWAELVGRYPELAQAQYRLPEFDDEWAPERRGELAHALATRLRAEEVLNPDRRATFTAQIRAYSPRAGGTYRGWRWEEPHHTGGPTFGVDRQVVCGDTMSGAVLVTGIVTVLGTEGRKFLVRDAEPAEAARLRCAEATWAAPPHLLPPG